MLEGLLALTHPGELSWVNHDERLGTGSGKLTLRTMVRSEDKLPLAARSLLTESQVDSTALTKGESSCARTEERIARNWLTRQVPLKS